MQLIKLNELKEQLIKKIKSLNIDKKLIIISEDDSNETLAFKKAILKRAIEFNIPYENFIVSDENSKIKLEKLFNENENEAFLVLEPFSTIYKDDLRKNIKSKDLDFFTYESIARGFLGDFKAFSLSVSTILSVLDYLNIDVESKVISIVNSSNLIGRPLFLALNKKKATVISFNSKSINKEYLLRQSDIIITAVGKESVFTKKCFKDGQVIIDMGLYVKNGKYFSDVDMNLISDKNLKYIGKNSGISAINTLMIFKKMAD